MDIASGRVDTPPRATCQASKKREDNTHLRISCPQSRLALGRGPSSLTESLAL